MPLRELQELVNPALLDASGLTLSSVMGSPGSGLNFEGTESSSIPRMSVDGLKSDRAVMDALTALKKRRTKSTEAGQSKRTLTCSTILGQPLVGRPAGSSKAPPR